MITSRFGPHGARWLVIAALIVASVLVSWAASSTPAALAVAPGVNCTTYDQSGGVCVIQVGDLWFCNASYQEAVCPTSIVAGDTVRWQFPASGLLTHTTTACGDDCDAPTAMPLWNSPTLAPGDTFERTFDTPGQYLYYCTFHPTTQRGLIQVLEAAPAPPTNLLARVVQDALSIDLSWQDNSDNEQSFVVERSTAGADGPWTAIATLPAATTSYFDSGLDDGVTYWYRVASANDTGMSPYTDVVSGTATALPAPALGDVDCDGRTNAIDATLILQLDASLIASLSCEQNADVNDDGRVDSVDATLILQLDAGLISSF